MSDLVRRAAHELAHALVGRAQCQRIRHVSILDGVGRLGTTSHDRAPGLGPFEMALTEMVTFLAGDIGERFAEPASGYVAPTIEEGDWDRRATEALAILPAEEAGFIADLRTLPSNGSDAVKAARLAEIAGQQRDAFHALAYARATRLVNELAPLIGALIPVLVDRLVMDGDAIEVAIAELVPQGVNDAQIA